MAVHYTQPSTSQQTGHPSAGLLARFSDPVDCLTAHLLLECAEVLGGVKPANLISLVNRPRPCGRNLYLLWHQHGPVVSRRIGNLEFRMLQDKGRALLLLCFDRDQLERQLAHAGIRTLLQKSGYVHGVGLDELLDQLKQRITRHGGFPHEIGLFIGYPAKDVAAFMGLVKLPFTCQGPWKIYGDPGRSLSLADQYRNRRHCMGVRLSGCDSLEPCLRILNHNSQLFFCQPTDNCDHYQAREAA